MSDALDFDRAAARIERNMLWIAAVGVLAAWAARGWRWAAGFLLGAAISWVNYRWLKRLVESLGGDRRPGGFRLAFRYLLLAGGAYAILRYSPISVLAVFAGLFVLIAAVFVEAACEIFYAGKRTLDHQDL
jgi:small-conductance mechanosensitive channel